MQISVRDGCVVVFAVIVLLNYAETCVAYDDQIVKDILRMTYRLESDVIETGKPEHKETPREETINVYMKLHGLSTNDVENILVAHIQRVLRHETSFDAGEERYQRWSPAMYTLTQFCGEKGYEFLKELSQFSRT